MEEQNKQSTPSDQTTDSVSELSKSEEQSEVTTENTSHKDN